MFFIFCYIHSEPVTLNWLTWPVTSHSAHVILLYLIIMTSIERTNRFIWAGHKNEWPKTQKPIKNIFLLFYIMIDDDRKPIPKVLCDRWPVHLNDDVAWKLLIHLAHRCKLFFSLFQTIQMAPEMSLCVFHVFRFRSAAISCEWQMQNDS